MELCHRATGQIVDEFGFRAAFPNVSFPDAIQESTFDEYGYDIIYPGDMPELPSPAYEIVRDGEICIDGRWCSHYSAVLRNITLDQYKAEKKAELEDARYAEEVGGIDWNGYTIDTDRESRATLDSVLDKFERGIISGSVVWKSSAGWTTINRDTAHALVVDIVHHVEAVFTKEKALSDAVDAATTFGEVDAITW